MAIMTGDKSMIILNIRHILEDLNEKEYIYTGNPRHKKRNLHYSILTYDLSCLSLCEKHDAVFYIPAPDMDLSDIKKAAAGGAYSPAVLFCLVESLSVDMTSQAEDTMQFPIIYIACQTQQKAKAFYRKISALIRLADNENVFYEGITNDLLWSREKYERNDMAFLCKLIDLEKQGPYRVFLLKNESADPDVLKSIRQMLRVRFGILLSTIWNDVLVCIVSGKQASRNQLDEIYRVVNEEMDAVSRISASSIKDSLSETHHGLQEALRTYDMIDIVNNSPDKIMSYDDLGVYRVLFELNDSRVFDDYCEKVFRPLWDYDKKNNTSLFQTLECYFMNASDIKQTATALYIHINTLRYRLNQIESILDRDLKNIHDITEIETAFKVRTMSEVIL